MQVLIVPDKFKGTLTAREAAVAIRQGWIAARPRDRIRILPMSDGGDGFGTVVSRCLGAEKRSIQSVDAAGRACTCHWWFVAADNLAVVESAAVIGLAMLPPGKFHPFDLDTTGLGLLLRKIALRTDRCIVGLGGSATNDGGFGLARAFGWTFRTRTGQPIERWTDLTSLATVTPGPDPHPFRELIAAVDVQNTLLGSRGATRVYGPQKGLPPEDLAHAEKCLHQLARIASLSPACRQTASARPNPSQVCSHSLPGAGAAGGLGFGLTTFLGARLTQGFELFVSLSGLVEEIRRADLVVTGEGCIDRSTLMGKGVGRIALLCADAGVPCIGLAGDARLPQKTRTAFRSIGALTQITTLAGAKKHPARWLQRLAHRAASHLSST